MKVLFVCRNNTGRSQAAMEFFRRLSSGETDSGGTKVEQPKLLVGERPGATTIVQAMKEYGIDMTKNPRKQLSPADAEGYDKIIVMAEPETVPDWLAKKNNVEYWDVLDIKDQPLDVARQLRDQILGHVGELLGYSDKDDLQKRLR
jgi:arsenate reductase (thioredoxin)